MRVSAWCWVALTGVLAAGCTSFRKDARHARSPDFVADDVEGLWEGRWYEAANPEHGGLIEAVLTRTGDTLYRASIRSGWWRLFSSTHETTLVLTPVAPGAYRLQGGKDLWLFGAYSITGRVDRTAFRAGYTAVGRDGYMEMRRPGDPDVVE